MSVSTAPILSPSLAPSDAHWADELRDDFARLKADCRAELASPHPGAMRRVLDLLQVAAIRRAQLEAVGAAS